MKKTTDQETFFKNLNMNETITLELTYQGFLFERPKTKQQLLISTGHACKSLTLRARKILIQIIQMMNAALALSHKRLIAIEVLLADNTTKMPLEKDINDPTWCPTYFTWIEFGFVVHYDSR